MRSYVFVGDDEAGVWATEGPVTLRPVSAEPPEALQHLLAEQQAWQSQLQVRRVGEGERGAALHGGLLSKALRCWQHA